MALLSEIDFQSIYLRIEIGMGVEEIDQNISDTFRKFQNFRDQFPATSQSIDYVHVLQGLSWETHTIQFKTIQRKY